MIIQPATRALLEQIAKQHGCTIKEEHRTIYYRSLDRSFDETFLTVMKDEHYCFMISRYMLEHWLDLRTLEHLFTERVPKDC